jgi:hypothetical protein
MAMASHGADRRTYEITLANMGAIEEWLNDPGCLLIPGEKWISFWPENLEKIKEIMKDQLLKNTYAISIYEEEHPEWRAERERRAA